MSVLMIVTFFMIQHLYYKIQNEQLIFVIKTKKGRNIKTLAQH